MRYSLRVIRNSPSGSGLRDIEVILARFRPNLPRDTFSALCGNSPVTPSGHPFVTRVTRPVTPVTPESALRAHFKTWCDRCGVSVKWTVFHVGFLHSGSVLASFRHRMEVLKCAL